MLDTERYLLCYLHGLDTGLLRAGEAIAVHLNGDDVLLKRGVFEHTDLEGHWIMLV